MNITMSHTWSVQFARDTYANLRLTMKSLDMTASDIKTYVSAWQYKMLTMKNIDYRLENV